MGCKRELPCAERVSQSMKKTAKIARVNRNKVYNPETLRLIFQNRKVII